MDFDFSHNLGQTIESSRMNFREYITCDFKELVKPVLALIIFLFLGLFFLLMYPLSNLGVTGSLFFLFLISFTIILVVLFFWFGYIVLWLTESKALHLVLKQSFHEQKYVDTLQDSIKFRRRIFIGSLISNLISFSLLIIFYVLFLFFIIGIVFLNLNSNIQIVFPILFSVFIIFALVFVLIIIKLTPLQLYPSILLIENKLNYSAALNRSFQLLPGWKNKIKFIISYIILIYLVNFASQFIIMAIIFGMFVVLLFISIFLHLNAAGLLSIFALTFVITFFLSLLIFTEMQNIVIGSFHGQCYLNVTGVNTKVSMKNSMLEPQINTQIVYCVNCGQPLTPEQKFCSSCGVPIKEN